MLTACVWPAAGCAAGLYSRQDYDQSGVVASNDLKGVRVRINDATVADESGGCGYILDDYKRTVLQDAKTRAAEVGLLVVDDTSSPVDATIALKATIRECGNGGVAGDEILATFSVGGVVRYGRDPATGWGNRGVYFPRELLKASGIVAELKRRREGRSPTDQAHGVASTSAAGIAGSPQPTAFALIVGIEKYRDVPAALGAAADLDRYKGLVQATLGVPDDHVHVLADDRASKADLEKELDWLKDNVPSGGRAYFFYSGHGAPDTATGTPYLVPYDGDPKALAKTAVPLSTVMNALQATKGKDALAVVDACFSGSGGRSVLPAGARPLVNVKDAKPTAKLALFTASTGAQISGPALDGKGGLFSQLVAEGLGSAKADIDEDGQVSLAELEQWVKPRVQREAKQDRRDQTPGLVLGAGAGRAEDFVVAYGVKR